MLQTILIKKLYVRIVVKHCSTFKIFFLYSIQPLFYVYIKIFSFSFNTFHGHFVAILLYFDYIKLKTDQTIAS